MSPKSFLLFILAGMALPGVSKETKMKSHFPQFTVINAPLDSVIRVEAVWFDESRNRQIPVAIYTKTGLQFSPLQQQKLVILSPGYPGKSTDYGYIARNLAEHNYLVVTVQNDLPTDAPIPKTGNLYASRLPFWNTGVANISFVKNKLHQLQPNADVKNMILIGHSNGGDISMLFATRYPDLVKTVISLDNRRVPIPKSNQPVIFTIRSMDQPADPGVLPTAGELKKYKITLVKVKTLHDDMGGMGTEAQLKEINDHINRFLNL